MVIFKVTISLLYATIVFVEAASIQNDQEVAAAAFFRENPYINRMFQTFYNNHFVASTELQKKQDVYGYSNSAHENNQHVVYQPLEDYIYHTYGDDSELYELKKKKKKQVHYHQHKHLHEHDHNQEHIHKHQSSHQHEEQHGHQHQGGHTHQHSAQHSHDHQNSHSHDHVGSHKHEHAGKFILIRLLIISKLNLKVFFVLLSFALNKIYFLINITILFILVT